MEVKYWDNLSRRFDYVATAKVFGTKSVRMSASRVSLSIKSCIGCYYDVCNKSLSRLAGAGFLFWIASVPKIAAEVILLAAIIPSANESFDGDECKRFKRK